MWRVSYERLLALRRIARYFPLQRRVMWVEASVTEHEFRALYDEQARRLLHYCTFRTGSTAEAEDISAEAFARLLGRGDRVRPDRRVQWLFAVARNLCTDRWREARRHSGTSVEESVEQVWADPAVPRALRSLSPSQQHVVFLRAIEDLPFSEVARITGRSEAAVKMQYGRAMKTLRRLLEEA